MIVMGGYNSSNTCEPCADLRGDATTFHVAEPDCLVSPQEIRHRPTGTKAEVTSEGWLPGTGPVSIGADLMGLRHPTI